LSAHGLHYVDVGTSGGVHGRNRGFCLMIGGEADVVARLDPIFAALAPGEAGAPPAATGEGRAATAARGYLHCGPAGAGHFVKMVHNGIEYGLMAAYAEGLNVLHGAAGNSVAGIDSGAPGTPRESHDYGYRFDIPAVAELWRRGSVIGSWLLDLTAAALARDPRLERFDGRVSDSGEGRWIVQTAVEQGVPLPVISAALYARFSSRGEARFADQVQSAMRQEFGGHVEGKDAG
jgi:6-phosphogluconate dehydrogenase